MFDTGIKYHRVPVIYGITSVKWWCNLQRKEKKEVKYGGSKVFISYQTIHPKIPVLRNINIIASKPITIKLFKTSRREIIKSGQRENKSHIHKIRDKDKSRSIGRGMYA